MNPRGLLMILFSSSFFFHSSPESAAVFATLEAGFLYLTAASAEMWLSFPLGLKEKQSIKANTNNAK